MGNGGIEVGFKEDFWRAWFGIHGGREVLIGNPRLNPKSVDRKFLKSPEELASYVLERETRREPCYLSVQPYRSRDKVFGLDRLFFDFDSKTDPPDLDKAWSEVLHFVDVLRRFYGLTSLITFSGRRGYHAYVWLWRTVEIQPGQEAWAKAVYKTLQDKLLKGLTYETLDPEVLGDIKRLARIPYTLHERSGLLCEPLTEGRQGLTALTPALEGYRRRGIQEPLFRRVVEEVKLSRRIKERMRARMRGRWGIPSKTIRPCIVEALAGELNGEPGHKMRLAAAVEYLNAGLPVDEVVWLFRGQGNFDEEKTRHYVQDAKDRGYKPFRRETLRRLGFCRGHSCSACLKKGRVAD